MPRDQDAAAPMRAPSRTLTSIADLVDARLMSEVNGLDRVAQRYSIAVTPEIVALIDRDDPNDPIARQFIPDLREAATTPQERADPIGDDAHSPLPGLVHRYPDRVLLKLLSVCPVYCRFCFRRETVGRGKGDLLPERHVAAALDYIARRPQIFEVILTGGDPLMLSARRLGAVSRRLAEIPHVRLLRVHTRAPTVAPDLVTSDRLAALRESGKTLFVALHVNHARELTEPARAAIAQLREAGAVLLSQTVLLKGVNDNVDVLERLMRDLAGLGVRPYYLHHPDLAPGTAHFRLSLAAGRRIYEDLSRRVTSVALPAYVLDIPGGFGKARVAEGSAAPDGRGGWTVVDRNGDKRSYRDELEPPQD
ncbi:lysine-2,3-aminomutase-like protein [Methylocystis rosea]|uniref:Lysine-2,3-aminomutase-like protein n=2 Tax=Methylocystis rosea TaxID=173366 RepID=A0A3G8M7H1_9HYPH|nr:lysine-2,3-aminomutase-like protein [Methylocystis rosea]